MIVSPPVLIASSARPSTHSRPNHRGRRCRRWRTSRARRTDRGSAGCGIRWPVWTPPISTGRAAGGGTAGRRCAPHPVQRQPVVDAAAGGLAGAVAAHDGDAGLGRAVEDRRGAGPPPSSTASRSASASAAAGFSSALASWLATSGRSAARSRVARRRAAPRRGRIRRRRRSRRERSRPAGCAPAPRYRRCAGPAAPAASVPGPPRRSWAAAALGDQRGGGQHRALRVAGGAGGGDHQRDVVVDLLTDAQRGGQRGAFAQVARRHRNQRGVAAVEHPLQGGVAALVRRGTRGSRGRAGWLFVFLDVPGVVQRPAVCGQFRADPFDIGRCGQLIGDPDDLRPDVDVPGFGRGFICRATSTTSSPDSRRASRARIGR